MLFFKCVRVFQCFCFVFRFDNLRTNSQIYLSIMYHILVSCLHSPLYRNHVDCVQLVEDHLRKG